MRFRTKAASHLTGLQRRKYWSFTLLSAVLQPYRKVSPNQAKMDRVKKVYLVVIFTCRKQAASHLTLLQRGKHWPFGFSFVSWNAVLQHDRKVSTNQAKMDGIVDLVVRFRKWDTLHRTGLEKGRYWSFTLCCNATEALRKKLHLKLFQRAKLKEDKFYLKVWTKYAFGLDSWCLAGLAREL